MDIPGLVGEIVAWLKEKLSESGAKGLALGLSGGVDSAVVATLCRRAAGKNALGLIMPCQGDPYDLECALKLAGQIGLEVIQVPLDSAYEALLAALPEGSDLAGANLKPRLRMAALYFVANSRNYLVVGTGNKSERMVGYFTKHGDGAADLFPIADLLKREVIEIAKHLGIPGEIICRPPTAGLWPGQTDEGEMGVTYRDLDAILHALERGEQPAVSPETLRKVQAMIRISEHKRRPPEIFKPPRK